MTVTIFDMVDKVKHFNPSFYREQNLSNLIQQKKFLKAIGVAIILEQPFRVLKIMKGKFKILIEIKLI